MPLSDLFHRIVMTDITTQLPRISDGPEGSDTLLGLTVHHEGHPSNVLGSDPWEIAKYHVLTEKWAHIGYHWVIDREGKLYQTLELNLAAFHAGYVQGDDLSKFPNQDRQHYNAHYDAVCLVGNYNLMPSRGTRAETEALHLQIQEQRARQMETLIQLAASYKHSAPSNFVVIGHGELPGKSTSCPGKHLDMNWLRGEGDKRVAAMSGLSPMAEQDPRFHQFPHYPSAARSFLGSADEFGNELVAVREHLAGEVNVLEQSLAKTKTRLDAVRRLTG